MSPNKAKKRQATHKAYKKNVKNTKNAQTTVKKDILRKINRQAKGNSINNTKNSIYNTEMLKKQTAVKNNRTKRRNRRTQQTQSRQPPDNDKMIDKRRKPTKPRTKHASSGIKETYHRKTSRQAIKQPEAHANAQNRKKTISPAGKSQKKHRAAQSAPNGKEEERI